MGIAIIRGRYGIGVFIFGCFLVFFFSILFLVVVLEMLYCGSSVILRGLRIKFVVLFGIEEELVSRVFG